MRRDDLTTPFDVEADDLTQEFWGAGRGWASDARHDAPVDHRTHQTSHDPTSEPTGSIRAIRAGFAAFRPRTGATGEFARSRRHGAPAAAPARQAPPSRREATLGELAAGPDAAELADHRWPADEPPAADAGVDSFETDGAELDLVPLSPVRPLADRLGLGAVDPLLARIGAVVVIVVVMVPIVLSLRPDRAESLVDEVLIESPMDASGAPPDGEIPADGVTTVVPSDPAGTIATPDHPVDAIDETQAGSAPATTSATTANDVNGGDVTDQIGTPTGDPVDLAIGSAADAAEVTATAERIVPSCPQSYRAATGDSWYRIADDAGIMPTELLAENNATIDTAIFPGDDICLPEGASVPTPPTTTVPTTEAPTTTAPPTTTVPTTTVPTTTGPVSTSEAAQIIRDVWPDELEERALQIAWRESGYQADAYNGWCCYGLFQIYYSVHATWLDDHGIHQASDLFDARKNAEAAYALYRSAGGWGPWGG